MKVKSFEDTDTALLEFSNTPVDETREIAEQTESGFSAYSPPEPKRSPRA